MRGLQVDLPTRHGMARAVRGVDFTLARGGTIGLVGESGCGKSLTAMALMGLLPEGARATGRVRFDGQELLDMPDAGLARLRGRRIAMVFQEPMTALNPVHTIGAQVAEPLRRHLGMARAEARARGRWHCWTAWAYRGQRSASTPIPMNFRAGSASASPSRWRWPAGQTC